jgi:hypothetical protein
MRQGGGLGSLDMVSVVVARPATIALAVFPFVAASFARLFQDMGGPIPLFTRIVLVPWQPLVALASAALVAFGVRAPRPLRQRRVALACAFAVSFFTFTACVVGLYLPIFALAGSIKPE